VRAIRFRPRLEALEDRSVPGTLTVLTTLDKGPGSLRDTLTRAKDGDTIVFDPCLNGQTITLTSDQLTLNKNLDIEGPGASLLAVSGNDTFRVFDVSQGRTVTIAGLTITHGLGAGEPATLTVTGSSITDNQATGGAGGARGSGGQGVGGGLYLVRGGVACLDVVTIVRNKHASTSDDDVFGTFTICP
jgi:hypothetical protein